jgi:outer membrane protein OmpA-like peptidoglycan-associated protein
MRIERCCRGIASPERGQGFARAVTFVLVVGLGGCAVFSRPAPTLDPTASQTAASPTPTSPAPPAPAPAPPPVPVLPFDEAVLKAADALFSGANLSEAGAGASGRRVLVIDPLIDGTTGFQAAATRSMQSRIVDLARNKYQQFEVREFKTASIAEAPIVLVGSLAGIDKAGKVKPRPEAYRIWLALADLRSGRIIAKGTARAVVEGVDLTPTAFFNDSPAWTNDRYVEAYLKTCGGKVGEPIDPVYLDGILTAALVGDAIEAYDAGRYQEALDLYASAASTPAGDQLRVYNGLYLANWRLGRREDAAAAFGRLVDYGLANKSLSVRLLFRPGSIAFGPPELAKTYPMWLEQLALKSARSGMCLEIIGHTSPTGPTALNERLSLLRAEHVRSRLETEVPALGGRMIANGVGSRENIIGTGRDDATDALDRRVEFKTLSC